MLADDIEAGGGSDEAVALALGYQQIVAVNRKGETSATPLFKVHGVVARAPAFLTDLNALAAECERRGWDISMHTDGGCPYAHVTTCDGRVFDSAINDAPTLARALCAALVRAVEAGNG